MIQFVVLFLWILRGRFPEPPFPPGALRGYGIGLENEIAMV